MYCLRKVTFSTLSILALATTFSTSPNRAAAELTPLIGTITAVGYNFCPRGWAPAEGQLLAISDNTALYSLIGTTYGGDGRTTFALPDLRGRGAMSIGRGPGLSNRAQGDKIGAEQVTLTVGQLPNHGHAVNANNHDGNKPGPGNKVLAAAPPGGTGSETIYSDRDPTVQMSSKMIANAGQGAPLSIRDPYLGMYYCIALQGLFPSRP